MTETWTMALNGERTGCSTMASMTTNTETVWWYSSYTLYRSPARVTFLRGLNKELLYVSNV